MSAYRYFHFKEKKDERLSASEIVEDLQELFRQIGQLHTEIDAIQEHAKSILGVMRKRSPFAHYLRAELEAEPPRILASLGNGKESPQEGYARIVTRSPNGEKGHVAQTYHNGEWVDADGY